MKYKIETEFRLFCPKCDKNYIYENIKNRYERFLCSCGWYGKIEQMKGDIKLTIKGEKDDIQFNKNNRNYYKRHC